MNIKKVLLFLLAQILFFHLFNIIPAQADEYKIFIDIPSRTLELRKDNKIEKTYPVGVGRSNFPTPTGNFEVITKITNPGWENPYKPAGISRIRPGKDNPLGTRWIGFHRDKNDNEYGMHGTNRPSSVGKYSSHGCVRMRIKDAEDLFDKVEIGTPVKVTYYTHKLKIKNNKLIIHKYPHVYKRKINPRKMINEQLELIDGNYNVNEEKLNQALKIRNGAILTIGEIIHTKENPDIFHNLSNFLKTKFSKNKPKPTLNNS
ncbi:MAG: hypothetical protein A2287_02870 [Candidatus Melainabacteria bacterium RIFOXYA12_FULL_32_12]|nr:MAG: hypothetical protein A2104_08385 [Candidatus Melainabacteria bacterium GWF2_32_7]OGI22723.1 MAG: hypothetical protein A2255_08315 [Candidatus Melainabacteria bacterium RIFOXYA2_FULL_32_9]OGI29326.1 MAG: hypothetical protein A2287_02870 [Candidatus Melainabacteria bacterium RIFOXYA12_FULL_32_12]